MIPQIYFLELEANYLREQAKKATEMHPKMTAEAERMLSKLRTLQTEADGLQLDVKRWKRIERLPYIGYSFRK